jgi:hypothetical protein
MKGDGAYSLVSGYSSDQTIVYSAIFLITRIIGLIDPDFNWYSSESGILPEG